jgi:hypothetical protein
MTFQTDGFGVDLWRFMAGIGIGVDRLMRILEERLTACGLFVLHRSDQLPAIFRSGRPAVAGRPAPPPVPIGAVRLDSNNHR